MSDDAELRRFLALSVRPDRLTLAALGTRPGVLRFMAMLEWAYFAPGTAHADEFQVAHLQWPSNDDALPWFVIVVPLTYSDRLNAIAREAGMRVADGVPTLIGGDEPQIFPFAHQRVFTLENAPGSDVYTAEGAARLAQAERDWLKAFWVAHATTSPKAGAEVH